MSYDIAWVKVNLKNVPHLVTPEIPGPKSLELHGRASKIMKGYSGQVSCSRWSLKRGMVVR